MSGFVRSGRTHCRKGHEYTERNTLWYRGTRHCKKCTRTRLEARKKRRQDAKLAGKS
jgi:hypothetical protein